MSPPFIGLTSQQETPDLGVGRQGCHLSVEMVIHTTARALGTQPVHGRPWVQSRTVHFRVPCVPLTLSPLPLTWVSWPRPLGDEFRNCPHTMW